MIKKIIYVIIFMLSSDFIVITSGDDGNEAQSLIKFKTSLSNDTTLDNWNTTVNPSPCNGNDSKWTGVRCNDDGTVFGLKLEQMGLTGTIDVDTLNELKNLRTLSFMFNNFDGPMPDVNKLTSLKVLYLSYNRFWGEIKNDAFVGMNSLKIVHLARNQFSGEIPKSVTALPKLTELNLEGNQFRGKIPNFRQKGLTVVNVADNQLVGHIPWSLSNMDRSFFIGNKGLCGEPLLACKSSKTRTIIIVAIAGSAVILFIIILIFIYIRKEKARKQNFKQTEQNTNEWIKTSAYYAGLNEAVPTSLEEKKSENGKLVFTSNIIDEDKKFELKDLLKASAEVLGSGSFGSCYKAMLLNRNIGVVVKRFRYMNDVGKQEFDEYMRRLGRLFHPNLLPIVAFYYRKEEKLLVYDYVPNGSLANLLHAQRARGEPGVEWPIRLKIIKGVARGLAYLYDQFQSQTLPHGHLKSSNVLIDRNFEPILTDYALLPIVNRHHARQLMVAYKSPEYTQNDPTTRKTDVWSLGILILEILTGKFQSNYLRQGRVGNEDLASWVKSVVREEWTGEVFDKDMKDTKRGEGEMLKLLKIGMCCSEWNVEKRWDLREAIEKIEDLKEKDDSDFDEFNSSCASEGDVNYALTEDDFSFSQNAYG